MTQFPPTARADDPDGAVAALRADARDNRERILAAARALVAVRGTAITMRDVARRARVGPATLYRRFPTRKALLQAVFADEVRSCRTIVGDGCADPDPWLGFRSVVERISVLNAANQGLVDALLSADGEGRSLVAHRAQLLDQLAGLARRAQRAGRLRADFVIGDLVLLLLALRGLAAVDEPGRATAVRRFAALALDAFAASPDHGELPPAPRRG